MMLYYLCIIENDILHSGWETSTPSNPPLLKLFALWTLTFQDPIHSGQRRAHAPTERFETSIPSFQTLVSALEMQLWPGHLIICRLPPLAVSSRASG